MVPQALPVRLAAAGAIEDPIVTTSPDVTVSTNLGARVNRRDVFRRKELADVFRAAEIPSAQKRNGHSDGQHVELSLGAHYRMMMRISEDDSESGGVAAAPVGAVAAATAPPAPPA